jgi:hypothetical protein
MTFWLVESLKKVTLISLKEFKTPVTTISNSNHNFTTSITKPEAQALLTKLKA